MQDLTTAYARLLREAKAKGFDFMVVGGNALNCYGYLRTTYDIDIAICDRDKYLWRSWMEENGYEVFFATEAFYRFRIKGEQASFPIDLMILELDTFLKLKSQSQLKNLADEEISVPDPIHLIAMKLHALKSEHRLQEGKDFQDIIGLIRQCQISSQDPRLRDILNRYASLELAQRILREIMESL